VLADLMTVKERFGRLSRVKLVYVGDGRNNVANSLLVGCAKIGLDYVVCSPSELFPDPSLVEYGLELAEQSGGSVHVSADPAECMAGAHVVYTDVWVSMGEERRFEDRIRLLEPYRVTMDMIRATGNLEAGEVVFLHCLPAFHDEHTELTRDTGALEVTDEVFRAPFSLVFEEAENRLHMTKAIFLATLMGASVGG
jgi:ornithine carbamoyltransferase